MSGWQVIENTGLTLVAVLERRLAALGLGGVTVGLATAAGFPSLAATATPHISVFLFQIGANAEMRNLAMRTLPDGSRQRQPLPLELSYLITPWGVRNPDEPTSDGLAAQEEARLHGAVLQACYEAAELGRVDLVERVAEPVWSETDGLQIALETLPVETHYRIWDAAELGYHLSLVYRVRVAGIEPLAAATSSRVQQADMEVA